MKHRLLLWLICITGVISAQKYSIIHGDTLKSDKEIYSLEVVGQDSSGFYVHAIAKEDVLYKLSLDKAKLIYAIPIQSNKDLFKVDMHRGYRSLNISVVNNKILHFVKIDDKGKVLLVLVEYDAGTGQAIGEPRVFDEQSTEGYEAYAGKLDFKVSFSPDKTKLLLVTEKKKNNTEPNVKARLYDLKKYNRLWEKQLIKVFNNSTVDSYNYLICNDGTLYYLFDFLITKDGDLAPGVGMIAPTNHQNKTYAIPSKGITTKAAVLRAEGDKILCYGKFLDGERKAYYMNIEKCGFFFICLDASTMKVESESFDYTEKYFYTTSVGIEDCKEVSVVRINGCYYFIKQYKWLNGNALWEQKIIICKYGNDNKLAWMKRIERNCSGPGSIKGDEIRGFNFLVTDKINLFFYEHKKNFEKFPDIKDQDPEKYTILKSSGNAVLSHITVNEAGELTRQIVPKKDQIIVGGRSVEELWIKGSKSIIVKNFLEKKESSYSIFTLRE